MEATSLLQALGKETLYIETLYLNLKIEKAKKGNEYTRDHYLNEAELLWKEIDAEYHSFLHYLQTLHQEAA